MGPCCRPWSRVLVLLVLVVWFGGDVSAVTIITAAILSAGFSFESGIFIHPAGSLGELPISAPIDLLDSELTFRLSLILKRTLIGPRSKTTKNSTDNNHD